METNVAGDPVTLYYSTLKHGQYLDATPTELPSIYAAFEFGGIGVGVGDVVRAGMAGWAYYEAHQIRTVNGLTEKYPNLTADGHLNVPASVLPSGLATWLLEGFSQILSVQDNGGGVISVQDWQQDICTVSATVSGSGSPDDRRMAWTLQRKRVAA